MRGEVRTLPKLPFPRTMRKLKSWIPTLTLLGPVEETVPQDRSGPGDRTGGKGSDGGGGLTWGREGVVASDWGS